MDPLAGVTLEKARSKSGPFRFLGKGKEKGGDPEIAALA
jgi:hypothetical protein